MSKEITLIEKILVFYATRQPNVDWIELWKIYKTDEKLNKLSIKSFPSMASTWKNSPHIKEEINRQIYEIEKEQKEFRAKIEEEISKRETKHTEIQTPGVVQGVNFLDRDEFLKFLNERANEIKDDKLRNDYLKMLSDNMRYKEAEKDDINEIQRFYTPITCRDCKLYQEAKEKLPK